MMFMPLRDTRAPRKAERSRDQPLPWSMDITDVEVEDADARSCMAERLVTLAFPLLIPFTCGYFNGLDVDWSLVCIYVCMHACVCVLAFS